jgi:DNA-directed RNA polymerase beta' subunit
MSKSISHIESFTLTRVNQATLNAFKKLDYDKCDKKTDIEIEYRALTGYDPSALAKNKQVCSAQCKQTGFHCIGHPLVIDVKHDYLSPFNRDILEVLYKVFCFTCGKVVYRPTEASTRKIDIFTFSRTIKSTSLEKHTGCNCFITRKVVPPKIPKKFKKNKNSKVRKEPPVIPDYHDFLNRLDKEDLEMFNLSKDAILGLYTKELILLPLAMQNTDEKTKKVAIMGSHLKLIDILMKTPMDMADFNRIMTTALSTGTVKNAFPSFVSMCEGKEGLFRMMLSRRTKGTGRAVIMPQSNGFDMGVLLCPEGICNTLKFNHIVLPHNILHLQKEIGNAVSHLITPSGYSKVSSFTKLKIGDNVLVKLRDGDPIVFHRNPTLHDGSLGGYEAKEWKNYCIGLHQINAPPHGADFDGDEGNLQLAWTVRGRLEMSAMSVKYRIFATKAGDVSMGIVYNGIIGCYLLSQDNNISEILFERLIRIIKCSVDDLKYYYDNTINLGIPFRSGRTLFSMLLPKNLNYKRKDVIIKQGFLIDGKLTKKDVSNGIISAIFLIDQWRMPYFFVNIGYALSSAYASAKGITIGIAEYGNHIPIDSTILTDLDKKVLQIEEKKLLMTDSARVNAERVILRHMSNIASLIDHNVEAFLLARNTVGDLANISFLSEARGSIRNVSSAIAPVGQLYIKNDRLKSTTRLSPYAPLKSNSIFNNGFVNNSYSNGLTPKETVYVSQTGRVAAYNTYSGTPESGSASRQAGLFLADIFVSDKFEVISRSGHILQHLYGIGANVIYTSKKSTPIGMNECPIDMLHILESL